MLEQLEFFKNRCEELEKEVKEANERTTSQNSKKKKAAKPKSLLDTPEYNAIILTDESLVDDDVENDPDWTKTPLYNRIQKLMVLIIEMIGHCVYIFISRKKYSDF